MDKYIRNKRVIETEDRSVVEEKEKSPNNKLNVDISINSKNNFRNSALRFSLYSERKNSFKSDKLPIVTYINPTDDFKKIGIPDFSKISKREENILVKPSKIPAICYYDPKYDYVKNSPVKIIKIGKESHKNKRKNLKKIFSSYDVSKDYQAVDFNLLVKKEEKEIDILLGT